MIPYIVKGCVRVTPYMGNPYVIKDIRIVMASDTAEAYTKYQDYWRDLSDEYGTYYSANCDVMETIL